MDVTLGTFNLGNLFSQYNFKAKISEIIKTDGGTLDSELKSERIRSGIPEQLIQPFVKGSTNYAAIRQHHFPLLEVRVPTSLDEQRRIASELNALKIEVEALKQLEAKTVVALDALLPAILERSFKGEL